MDDMDDIPLQDFDFSVLDDPEYKEDSVREDAEKFAAHLRDPPPVMSVISQLEMDAFPLVTIYAHRTNAILENEREMYLPLEVIRFEPA